MASCSNILVVFLVLLWVFIAKADTTIDLKKYGGIPGGKIDNTKALQKAWADACAAEGKSQIIIPHGDYLVGPILFKGPCKGPVTIQLDGNLLADANLGRYESNWLDFHYIDGLTFKGRGKLDGQGASAWPHNSCPKKWSCKLLPMTMSLSFVTNSSIRGITSLNPKFFHMNLFSCHNLDLRWLTISAPGDSPNTDGIHMGGSSNIAISDSAISTGDDCISVGSGTTNVTVSGVTCGPGHGISVGSLGKDADKGDVVGLTVKDCTLTGTSNGLRIKSWKMKSGSRFREMMKVENFLFENVVMKNVANPIFIDQEYCPYAACPESEPSRVKINGIKFRNIRGTSSSDEVIKMVCSRRYPCEGVELRNIYLQYIGNNTQLKERATCTNVKGTSSNVKPVSCF